MRIAAFFVLLLVMGSAFAADKGSEHAAKANEISGEYAECVINYARKYSASTSSASEIAVGAQSECEGIAEQYRDAMLAYARSNIQERQALEFAEKTTTNLRAGGRGAVINMVIKARAAAGNGH